MRGMSPTLATFPPPGHWTAVARDGYEKGPAIAGPISFPELVRALCAIIAAVKIATWRGLRNLSRALSRSGSEPRVWGPRCGVRKIARDSCGANSASETAGEFSACPIFGQDLRGPQHDDSPPYRSRRTND